MSILRRNPDLRAPAALVTLLAAACSGGTPVEPPVEGVLLACDAPSFDFGAVWEGGVVQHEFRLVSRGTQPAVVQGARADCGCTVARLEREQGGERVPYEDGQPLALGEPLFVEVTYDTTGKSGIGKRQITLFCNEPDGIAQVSVTAEVRRRFRTEPDPPPAGKLAMGGHDEVVFDVVGVGPEPFRLEHEERGLPPAVAIGLEPADPDAEGRSARWHVRVGFGPETPRGTHSYPVFLRSDLAREDRREEGARHTFAPFVMVQVDGRFTAEPPAMRFGALALDTTASSTVRITCNDPGVELPEPKVTLSPLTPERNLAWAEHATLHVRPVPGARAWDVELVLEGLGAETDPSFLGRLDVETGHPLEPVLYVNVSGFRSDRGNG